jgi:hypothetical protein
MAYLFFNLEKKICKTALNDVEKNTILTINKNLTEKSISDSEYEKFEKGLIRFELDNQGNVTTINVGISSELILGPESSFISGPIYNNIESFNSEKNDYISLINDFLANNSDVKWSNFKQTLENLQNPSNSDFPMLKNLIGYLREKNITCYHITRLP